jgi:Na+-transporting NADH:ubiquinone oxidoreductase subunit NqrF
MLLLSTQTTVVIASVAVFLGVIVMLVAILLYAKKKLTPSGEVKMTLTKETGNYYRTGQHTAFNAEQQQNSASVGLRGRRNLCHVPLPDCGRRRFNFAHRNRLLYP